MAGKAKYNWPSDDELVELIVKAGSRSAAARSLGVPVPTFASHLESRPELQARIDAALSRPPLEAAAATVGEEVTEVEMLRQEVAALRKRLLRVRDGEVAEERFTARLERSLERLRPSTFVTPKKSSAEQAPHEMALLFSDTHAYEIVRAEETLNMNTYNRDVLLERMERLRDRVLSFVAHRPYPVKVLHLWMLGDMLSGDIHDELAQTNEFPHEEAVVQFALDCAAWLEGFVPYFEEIRVAGVVGNHPRRAKKPTAKMAHNNSDWTAYKIIELYHRGNPAFVFNFPRAGYTTVQVADRWNTLLMHGDGIRSSMPGVPWGGVVRRITVLEQQFAKAKQPIDYAAMGHFHTANFLDGVGVKTFLNGSVKGLDEYSLRQFGSGRPPSQLLLTFHKAHGITDVSTIDLVDSQPARLAA